MVAGGTDLAGAHRHGSGDGIWAEISDDVSRHTSSAFVNGILPSEQLIL